MWGYFTTFFIFSCLTFFLTEKAFVHEWAHFQWGVFDEYNNEEKFYTSKGKPEAVRCVHFDFALPNNFTVQPIFPWVTFKIPAFCLISSGPVNWVPTLWIVAVCSLPGASACDLCHTDHIQSHCAVMTTGRFDYSNLSQWAPWSVCPTSPF